MNKKKKLISILLVIAMLIGVLSGCSNSKSVFSHVKEKRIKSDDMMSVLKELTSPKIDGRKVGTEGNKLASEYIADYFKKIGLENPKGLSNYMQPYTQQVVLLKDTPTLKIMNNGVVDFKYPDNFVFRTLSTSTNNININAPIFIMEDISQFNEPEKLKGKVLLFSLEFKKKNKYNIYNIVNEILKCGALGGIDEVDISKNGSYSNLVLSSMRMLLDDKCNPMINVDSATYKKLVDATNTNSQVQITCNFNVENNAKASNVIGLIPGKDPKLKDEYIIIGAHFDHQGSNLNGTYNPGALDNASGTVAMMEVAKVLKESKIKPKKSILFIAFNGEETGLTGSEYYTKNPVYPLDKAEMINLDMVGSSTILPLSIVMDSTGSILRNNFSKYAKELSINCEKEVMQGGSDHAAFSEKDVPAVCLINMDMKSGYHSPNDTVEDVNGDRLKEVVKLVLYYIEKQAL